MRGWSRVSSRLRLQVESVAVAQSDVFHTQLHLIGPVKSRDKRREPAIKTIRSGPLHDNLVTLGCLTGGASLESEKSGR